jgi:hypothetical protein
MHNFFSMSASEDWDKNKKDRLYWEQVFTHFSNLVDTELEYFGACDATYEFKLDDIIFRVLEDPNDGYRSCLGVIEYGEQSNSIFFRTSVAKVRIETYSDLDRDAYNSACQGYRLVDVDDGHIWLEFGTDNTDDYYPYFIFRHMPKEVEIETSR